MKKRWIIIACWLALLGTPLQSVSSMKGQNEKVMADRMEKETEEESETESETETESESGLDSEIENDAQNGERETESLPPTSENGAEPDNAAALDGRSGAEAEADTPEPENTPAPEISGEPMAEEKTEPEGEPAAEEETETQGESAAEEETETKGESAAEEGTKTGPNSETGTEDQTEPPSESEPETEEPAETEFTSISEAENVKQTEPAVKAEAETEESTEFESVPVSESEPEEQSEPSSSAESEMQGSTETEPTSEAETEGETEPFSESEPETEEQTETESVSEAETEAQTEPSFGSESETEPLTETEPILETETEPVTETEPQTEEQKKIIIQKIQVAYPNQSRYYDGTRKVALTVKTSQKGAGEVSVEAVGEAESQDAGSWNVKPHFVLKGKNAEEFTLESTEVPLYVTILPRPLTITIGDAQKEYGSPLSLQNLSFPNGQPAISVSGFMKDGLPTTEIPAGFELPRLDFDRTVIQQDSPMYQNGQPVYYENALIAARTADGSLTGNPTKNYTFNLSPETYRKGTLSLTSPAASPYTLQIQNGAGYTAEDGTLWLSKGSSLAAVPGEGSGFNRTLFSEKLTETGEWTFALERRSQSGELLALSRNTSVPYRIDTAAPNLKILYNGSDTNPTVSPKEVKLTAMEISDAESGVKSVEAAVRSWENRAETSAYRTYTEGEELSLTQEGRWQVFFKVRDQVGNTKTYASGIILIDSSSPAISFSGIEEGESCQNPGTLKISIKDKNLSSVPASISLTNEKGKTIECPVEREKRKEEEILSLKNLSALQDGSCLVKVKAADQAGNEAAADFRFQINRSGSTYIFSNGIQAMLRQYYLKSGTAFSVTEKNKDRLLKHAVVCVKDGKFYLLREGKDYQLTCHEEDNGWSYQYSLFQKCFEEEGIYSVVFQSLDQAGNRNDSREKGGILEFFVDQTGPMTFLSGLEKWEEAGEKEVLLWARDNGKLNTMELWQDGRKILTTDQEKANVKVSLKSGKTDFRILAKDAAGNAVWSENYRTYVGKEGKLIMETGEEESEYQEWTEAGTREAAEGEAGRAWMKSDEEAEPVFTTKKEVDSEKSGETPIKTSRTMILGILGLAALWLSFSLWTARKMDLF